MADDNLANVSDDELARNAQNQRWYSWTDHKYILKFRQGVLDAQGLYTANGEARVHVDAVAANAVQWCNEINKNAEKIKENAVRDAAKRVNDALNNLKSKGIDWRSIDPHTDMHTYGDQTENNVTLEDIPIGIKLLGDDRVDKQLLMSAYDNYNVIRNKPVDDYAKEAFGGAFDGTENKIRYNKCIACREAGEAARNDFDLAEDKTVYLPNYGGGLVMMPPTPIQVKKTDTQARAANDAAKADDECARVNGNTKIDGSEKALYWGEMPLDAASYMPVVGTPASLALSGLYLANGRYLDAGTAAFGAFPGGKEVAAVEKAGAGLARLGEKAAAAVMRHQTANDIRALARMSEEDAAKAIERAGLKSDIAKTLKDKSDTLRKQIEEREAAIAGKRKVNERGEPCEACSL